MEYLSRISDCVLEERLQSSGAVLIEGPKWCGKTSTGAHAAKSIAYLQDPDKRELYKKMVDSKPSLLLQGKTPRLLDEWQTMPILWDAVRFAVDQRQAMNQFILTGSATPLSGAENAVIEHSGVGRIARLRMYPMSLWESRESNGQVSLSALFDGTQEEVLIENKLTLQEIAFALCRGGWPGSLILSDRKALQVAYNYLEELIELDIQRLDDVDRDPGKVRAVLRSYARNVSTLTPASTIMQDVRANDISVTDKTLSNYLNALRRLFIVEDLKAWRPSLRSKTAIRSADKRHFVDPSIAVALLGLTPKSMFDDFNLFGYLFEDMCVRDMRAYVQSIGGEVYHYHDFDELEADMVIRLHDGRWAPVEVKMGNKEIETAALHLLKLKNRIDTSKVGEPSFMMVLTAGEYGYRRQDGVWVVPIGSMKN